MQKRNHHYVPQVYLKHFIDTSVKPPFTPYLWVYYKDQKEFKNKAPKNVAYEKGLYDLVKENGEISVEVEDQIKYEFEDRIDPITKKILDFKFISYNEQAIFAEFVFLMLNRTPFFKNVFNKAMSDPKRFFLKANYWEPFFNSEDEVPKEFFSDSIPRVAHIAAEIILKMNWQFIVSPKETCFITSDNPAVLMTPSKTRDGVNLFGFSNKDCQLTMPLSPKICFRATWKETDEILYDYIYVDAERVKKINKITYHCCTNEIYSHNPNLYF